MATRNYPLNTTFKSLSDASFKLGGELNRNRPSVKQYSGVAGAVQDAGKQGQTGNVNLGGLEKLGPISVPYSGSTKFEGNHPAYDIAAPTGTDIPSPISGQVVSQRTGVGWTGNKPSYGNFVILKDSKGNYHRFSHLSETYVPLNTNIVKGDIIGKSGFSGSTYSASNPNKPGPHIDYRVFSEPSNTDGLASKIESAAKRYYDPSQYLKQFNQ